MREYDVAVGKVTSACSALKIPFHSWWDQGQVIEIQPPSGLVTVFPSETRGCFTAVSVRRLTNIEGFDLTQSRPIVNAESEVADVLDQTDTSNVRVSELTDVAESEGLEYLDGCRSAIPLFVYDDTFGAKEFDEAISTLNNVSSNIFNQFLNVVDVNIDEIDETAAAEEQEEEVSSPAFQ